MGPVLVTAAAVSGRSAPGVLAASVAGLISVAAWAGRALFEDMSTGLFLAGVIVPVVLVAVIAVAHRLRPVVSEHDTIWELTVRTGAGWTLRASLRTDAERDSVLPGDLVRMTPARHAGLLRKSADRLVPMRTVEILDSGDGPPVHRIEATSALPPVQIAGLVLAIALLAATAVSFLTA